MINEIVSAEPAITIKPLATPFKTSIELIVLPVIDIPILLLGVYDSDLSFPLFGDVKIPLLSLGVVVIMISITGNTINSIDVLNGVASGFMVIAGSALTISLIILQNYAVAIASLMLAFASLAFYKY